ncbi:MAG: hypothetical protein J7M14_00275, partial [Planctomycetes bacterium]|nr:hypothetical protein [Planctomycetota bacterium]
MADSFYYLLASLPHLGDPGAPLSLTTQALLEKVRQADGPDNIVEALLLGDDLVQREAILAGEITQGHGAVLSEAQLRNDQPLPPYLARAEREDASGIAADELWGAYFHHAADVADRSGCAFLAGWVRHEVALRNALAGARAKALDLDGARYVVAPQLAEACDDDFSALINEWTAAENPLAGLRVIDGARWNWIARND